MAASVNMTPEAMISGRRPESSCLPNRWTRLDPDDARVTTMPPAIETSSDGIMVTRPSPTVSTGVSLQRLVKRNIQLKDANEKTGDDVDRSDEKWWPASRAG